MGSAEPGKLLFMGVVEDPELDVHMARGSVRVYDGTFPMTEAPRPPPHRVARVKSPAAGHWVLNGTPGRWTRCGCNRCYTGPCPTPIEG
jgi:hypothetical protein